MVVIFALPNTVAHSLKLHKDRTDLGEDAISASLTQFDDMWNALIPAEQARVVKLLVARVTARRSP